MAEDSLVGADGRHGRLAEGMMHICTAYNNEVLELFR